MLSARRVLATVATCAASAGAFGCTEPDAPGLHPDDRLPRDGFRFDKDTLIGDEELHDTALARADAIQRSLEKTRYNQPSFLATYRSQGVLASAALERTAKRHRINPKVLVVFSQLIGQLVSSTRYPLPPSRVEYAFGCGCGANEVCEQASGGYGAQLECLAARLETSMATLEKGGATKGGWAVGKPRTTLDGVRVVPTNAATASIYEILDDVSEDVGGAWLFAVLYSKDGWL